MADILVRLNQAATDLLSWANLKARHIGFSNESKSLCFKREDGTDYGDPVHIPSTIGQGMGRRVSQVAHGFATKNLIRYDVDTSSWVLAIATSEATLATHMVVRVLGADSFEVASMGAWSLGGTPAGTLYLSETTAGAATSTAPTTGVVQVVAHGDGTSYHLAFAVQYHLDLDQLVDDLNDRDDLTATPKGAASGDLTGEYPNPIVKQLSGVGAELVPVTTDFSWNSSVPGFGGRGISPGRVFISGVEKKVWAAQEAMGQIHFTLDNWKSSYQDTSLIDSGMVSGVRPPVIRFLRMAGIGKDAWVVGGDNGVIYYAPHESANYNANGTLKSTAWVAIPPPTIPHLVADIGVAGNVCCTVGNHGYITRTTDWITFTDVYSSADVIGGIDTDRYGNWIAVKRDTGKVLMSTDNGLTWTEPAIYVNDLPVANLHPVGSVTAGNGVWLASGNSAYSWSLDGIHWCTGTNTLGSFYCCGFDGTRFYATNPNPADTTKIFQLLLSEIAVHRHLVAEQGATVAGALWLPDLPSATSLGTDANGLLYKTFGMDDLGAPPADDFVVGKVAGEFAWVPNSMLSGVVEGLLPELAKDGVAGTVTVPSLKVQCYDGANFFGTPKRYTTTEQVLSIPDGVKCFVAFRLIAGIPSVYLTTDESTLNLSDRIPLYIVTKIGTEIHSIGFDTQGAGLPQKTAIARLKTEPYRRTTAGGLSLSEDGARHVAVSAAEVYAGTTDISVLAYSSTTDSLVEAYHVAGAWAYNVTASGGVYDNTNIDNGTAKVAMTNNKYKNVWFFRTIGDDKEVFYVNGSAEYNTLEAAKTEQVPSLPPLLTWHGMLVGRIIVQKSAVSGLVQSAFSIEFAAGAVTLHNDLAGIQGGDAGDYYHLTAAQLAGLLAKSPTVYDAICNTSAEFLAAMQSATVESIWVRGTAVTLDGTVTVPSQKRIYGEGVGFSSGLSLTVNGSVRFRNNKIDVNGAVTIAGSAAFYTRKFNGSNTVTYSGSSTCQYELLIGTTVTGTGASQAYWDNSNTNTGSGSGATKWSATMDLASASANVSVAVATSSQWTAHATIFIPCGNMTLVAGTSKLAMVCPQPVSGASYILALYKWPSSGTTLTRVAATAVQTMPGSSSWLEATISTLDTATLNGGERYFLVILWNGNGAQCAGVTGANLNVQPYIAFTRTNLGVLSAAPSTLIPESETNIHLFHRVVV